MFPGPRFLGHSFRHCPGFPRLWGSPDVSKRSGSRFTAPTEPTPLSLGASDGAVGRWSKTTLSSQSPWSSPQLSYERVRLKERLQGPDSGAEGAVWRVSAHCEDRGMEEQGKVGNRRSGACLVDSGLAWDESSQTFCPSRYVWEQAPISHLITP